MAAGRILRAGAGVCLPAAPPAARFVRTGQPQHSPRLRLPQRFCTGLPVAALRRRLAQSGQFPHEIGLFLGYPPCDVLGFLHDAGRHSKLSGYWQVYGDAQAALALFAKYKKVPMFMRAAMQTELYLAAHRSCLTYSLKESRVL